MRRLTRLNIWKALKNHMLVLCLPLLGRDAVRIFISAARYMHYTSARDRRPPLDPTNSELDQLIYQRVEEYLQVGVSTILTPSNMRCLTT